MWLRKSRDKEDTGTPEKVRYSRYYEHDGALRAYANRAMVLAFLCVPATMLALGFAVYVRLHPTHGPAQPRHSNAERLATFLEVWPVAGLYTLNGCEPFP